MMITWVTVWVLNITSSYQSSKSVSLQQTYSTQEVCKKRAKHYNENTAYQAWCDFQQVPVVMNK